MHLRIAERKNELTIFGITLVILTMLHMLIPVPTNDDIWFGEILKSTGPIAFLRERYQIWSSRLVIEFLLIYVASLPGIVWRILDIAFLLLIGWSLKEISRNASAYLLVLFIPLEYLSSAGYIATSINYIWPSACALVMLLPILRRETGYYIAAFLALPLACSQEQVAITMLFVYGIFIVKMLVSDRQQLLTKEGGIVCALFVFICLAVAVIALCPGNKVRAVGEMQLRFPEFEMLTFPEKALIGILHIGSELFQSNYVTGVTFANVLIILIFIRNEAVGGRNVQAQTAIRKVFGNGAESLLVIADAVALAFLGVLGFGGKILVGKGIAPANGLFGLCGNDRLPQIGSEYDWGMIIVELLIFVFYFGLMLVSLIRIGRLLQTEHAWFLPGCLVLSLMSGAMIGLSPSTYESFERTAIPCYSGILIICSVLFNLAGCNLQNKKARLGLGLLMVCLIAYILQGTFGVLLH